MECSIINSTASRESIVILLAACGLRSGSIPARREAGTMISLLAVVGMGIGLNDSAMAREESDSLCDGGVLWPSQL